MKNETLQKWSLWCLQCQTTLQYLFYRRCVVDIPTICIFFTSRKAAWSWWHTSWWCWCWNLGPFSPNQPNHLNHPIDHQCNHLNEIETLGTSYVIISYVKAKYVNLGALFTHQKPWEPRNHRMPYLAASFQVTPTSCFTSYRLTQRLVFVNIVLLVFILS